MWSDPDWVIWQVRNPAPVVDGPAELVFLLVGTLGDDRHLKLLTQLARALVKPAFTQALREAASPAHARDLVADTVGSL